jgi:hypothetical protein
VRGAPTKESEESVVRKGIDGSAGARAGGEKTSETPEGDAVGTSVMALVRAATTTGPLLSALVLGVELGSGGGAPGGSARKRGRDGKEKELTSGGRAKELLRELSVRE